ncbi:STE/STE20/SLK protein kinase [Dirofilaria immitis]|nr:STE/STE20/SLK protein kinase [Dirofilaria immitis]
MNPAKVIFKVIKADPPTLERPKLWSPNFRAVVTKCLTKDPGNRPSAADILASGSIQCIRSLISEVNAEQITTEVVVASDDEALYDDDDDDDDDDTATLSSVATTSEIQPYDTSSVSSKQQRHSSLSVTEQKMPSQTTAFTSKLTADAGVTTVVELAPATEISSNNIETDDLTGGIMSSSLLPAKGNVHQVYRQTAEIAIVEINADGQDKSRFLERSNSTGSCKSSGQGHHHAAVIALSDLDKALNLEEESFSKNKGDDDLSLVPILPLSPDFLPSEYPDPVVSILSVSEAAASVSNTMANITNPSLNVSSKSKVKDDAVGVELKLEYPKSNHQIRNNTVDEKYSVQLLGQPTTVEITETGAVVTTSDASMNKHLAETNAQVKLERPNAKHEANFVHMLKVEDSQQLKIGNEESGSSTATQRCLSQPQVVSSSKVKLEGVHCIFRHLIPAGSAAGSAPTAVGINYLVGKLPLGVFSLSTDQLNVPAIRTIYKHIPDFMLQSSPLLENKQMLKQQHSMRTEFKIPLPKAETKVEAGLKQPFNLSAKNAGVSMDDKGTEKTIIEIRRPLSYPESNGKQTNAQEAVAVSSSCGGSSPPQPIRLFSRHSAVVTTRGIDQQQERNRNRIKDQIGNGRRVNTEWNQEQNKVILKKNITEQKKDKIGNESGALPNHQFTPTTSNKRREIQLEQEYDYFGTASSSSSNSSKHFQQHNYESNSNERGSSNFLTAIATGGGVASTGTAVVSGSAIPIPRTVLTIPPPEPPVDYYENINGGNDGKKSSNADQKCQPLRNQ